MHHNHRTQHLTISPRMITDTLFYKIILFSLLFFNVTSIINTSVIDSRERVEPLVFDINLQELDIFCSRYMSELHVPGATLVVVKDGKIFFGKGYGFAKINGKIPVDPAKTIFRVASISKLLTATAVMQLVEQGRMKLNEDVNIYLSDFKIKNAFSTPITVANLLTHTAGFDYEIIGTATLDERIVKSLREYLSSEMPNRIYPPGYMINYSNYGYALAGYLVEQVSGLPFIDYIEKHILEPLEMKSSGFLQIPKTLDNFAQGYVFKNKKFQKMPFEYYNTIPAACFYTTANDIANFMIAHLQEGRFKKKVILKTKTAKSMHKRQFSHHPGLPGFGYAFCEYYFGKHRFLIHEGEVAGFKSLLVLNPEISFGFFISINCEPTFGDSAAFVHHLKNKLLSSLFQENESAKSGQHYRHFKSEIKQIIGNYRSSRYSHDTLTKVDMLFADVKVRMKNDGSLFVDSRRFLEIFPMVFQPVSGEINWRVTFKKNDKLSFMFIGPRAFEKLKWYETENFQMGIIVFCLILFFISPIIWMVQALVNKSRNKPRLLKVTVRAYWIAGSMSVLNICLLITLAIFKSQFIGIEIVWNVPIALKISLVIGICSAILTVFVMICTWIIINTKIGIVYKIHYLFVAIAGVGFIWFLNYWNLLGFRY